MRGKARDEKPTFKKLLQRQPPCRSAVKSLRRLELLKQKALVRATLFFLHALKKPHSVLERRRCCASVPPERSVLQRSGKHRNQRTPTNSCNRSVDWHGEVASAATDIIAKRRLQTRP